MSQAEALLTMPAIRSEETRSQLLAILIEVPAVMVHPVKRSRAAVSRRPRPRHFERRRPRRRLRRPVRLAGCALLTLAPLLSLCTLGWTGRPGRVLACAIPETAHPGTEVSARISVPVPNPGSQQSAESASPIGSSDVATLAIEPVVAVPGSDGRVPVIFPGYVLPDDGFEDKAHAGS